MKSMYIGRHEKKHSRRSYLTIILAFVVLVLLVRVFAPIALREYVNRSGKDEKGYTYKVGDINLKLLKGKVEIEDLNVFHAKSKVTFAEAENLVMDLDWRALFDDKKSIEVKGKEIDITISKDFFEEINRVKNEAKKANKQELYLDKLKGFVETVNFYELKDNKSRNFLTLKNTEAEIRDLGLGSINENTEFKMTSGIAEGGKINLSGKTRLEANATPWEIEGKFSGIPGAVIEKLAGDRLPLDIEKANINASISAQSKGGQVEGVVIPDIKDLKFSDKKDEGFFKRNLAKATNFLFQKADKEFDFEFKLPFILNQNFTLNIPETINKLEGKNL